MSSAFATEPPDAQASAARLAELTGAERHDIAIVLGSGWLPAADLLGAPAAEFDLHDLGGFPPVGVFGHSSAVRSIDVGGRRVLAFLGRVHAYEGHDLPVVVHAVRTACAAGVKVVALTNAAGGLREGLTRGPAGADQRPPEPVQAAPRSWARGSSTSPSATAARLRDLARSVDPALEEGVYAYMPGPQFETPAEIRALQTLGADLVGMSTVYEAIAARAEGVEVLGLSLVTNLAAGLSGDALEHEDVLAVGRASAPRMGALLAEVVRRL